MKLKVLHIINSMSPGGAEILLANSLAVGGLCEYIENHLLYFREPSYLLDRFDKNVTIHFLNYKGASHLFKLIIDIRKIIIKNNINIVHSHLNPADLYTYFACPKNVPHVHTMHTAYSMDKVTSKIKLWTEKYFYLLKKDTNLIFLSDFMKEDFLESINFKGKAFVLNNFVSEIFFKKNLQPPSPDNKLKLVAVGRLEPVKNFEYLFEVFTYLRDYNIQLDIYGNGNVKKYEKIIAEKNINIKMKGHQNNISSILQQYHALIMPSKFEGFGLALYEAMAAEVPVLLSNIVPFSSNVKDNAIYFELDNAAKTADIIKAVYNKEIDIKALAQKAKIFANENVRRDKYITKLLSIYEDIKKPVIFE